MAIKKYDKIYTTDIVFQEMQKYSRILKTTPFDERYYTIENRRVGYPIYANQIKLREYNYTSVAGANGSVSGMGKYTVFNTPDYIEYDIIATPNTQYKIESWSISGGSDAKIIGETGKTVATTGKLHINKKCYGDITVKVEFKIAKKLTSLYISSGSWAKQWTGGDVNYSGLVFTATYDDGSTENVTSKVILTSPSSGKWTTTQGNQTATFRYTYNEEYRECTSTVYVYKKPVTLSYSGSWSTPQYVGNTVNISTFTFTVKYSDGTSSRVSYSSVNTNPTTWRTSGPQTCQFSYTQNDITVYTTSPSITISNRVLTDFYISGGSWGAQWTDESVYYWNLQFTAKYSDGSSSTVWPSSCSPTSWSAASGLGSYQTVTFTYNGLSCSSTPYVYRKPKSLTIYNSSIPTQYVNQAINLTGVTYEVGFYDGGNTYSGSASSLGRSVDTWGSTVGTQYCTFTFENGPSGDTRRVTNRIAFNVQESITYLRVGGKIFAYDSLSGYTFYDENKNVLSGIGVGSSPYYYSKTSGSSGNIYILYNGNNQGISWGYYGTSTGASDSDNGASNTSIIMNRSDIPSNSVWAWIKSKRSSAEYGCSDWYLGAWNEIVKLKNSGVASTYFEKYNVWTSTESRLSTTESQQEAICWDYDAGGIGSWMYFKKNTTSNTLVTAIRKI